MDEVEETLPGWYRQQSDPTMLRWWDGTEWTDDVIPAPEGLDEDVAVPPDPDSDASASGPEPEPEPVTALHDDAIPNGDHTFVGTFGDGVVERDLVDDDPTPRRTPPRPRPVARPERRPERRPPDRRPPEGRPADRQPAERRAPSDRGRAPTTARRPVARGAWQPARSPRGRHVRRSHTQQLVRVAVRALLVALVAVLAYVLLRPLIEGGDSAATLATDPRPTTTVASEGSGAEPLTTALLKLSDLPTGWGIQAEFTQSRVGFCGGRNPLSVLVPTEEHHQTFSKGAGGPFIFDLAARYDTRAQAKQLMDLVAETVETCRTYDENGGHVNLTPLDFPKLGDETFAAHLTGGTSQGPLEGDLVWIRKGDRVVSISSLAFGDFDSDLVALISQRLEQRL